jgi:hypothetical protein
MGADRPDEGDVPPDGRADRRDDQSDDGAQSARPGRGEAETRSRGEYYVDLRTAVSKDETAAARRIAAEEQAAAEKWEKTATESRWVWGEYQRRWPPEERPTVDRSSGASGSWRGEGNRELDHADNDRVEARCDRIAELERGKISPALRAIESQDPGRHLVGFGDRLKDRDRIKEKVYGVRLLSRGSRLGGIGHNPGSRFNTLGLATLRASGPKSDV